jgi:hypothetical protein|tara:strand:+ start:61 stop:642 length:582 start_codon:yes stop_codon:yes gene_type:complete
MTRELLKQEKTTILQSFPSECQKELKELLNEISIQSEHVCNQTFRVNKSLQIPGRIYWEEHKLLEPTNLSELKSCLLSCILTRHHNGYTREKHLKNIITSKLDWTAIFILQLCGEYVIQILDIIYSNLNPDLITKLKTQIEKDPKFWELTKSRITSYWDCYYRKKDNKSVLGYLKKDYVGFKIIQALEEKTKA